PRPRWRSCSAELFDDPDQLINAIALLARKADELPSAGDWFDLAWSPDGTRLACESGGTILVMHPEQPNRDAVPLPITGQGTLVDEGVNGSPPWASDGARIAYASVPRGEQSAAVYVVDVDGSHLRRVAAHGYAPSWSPDGTRIAYSLSSGLRLVTPAGRDVT